MVKREFFIDNLLVRVHFIIVMIRWTGPAPWGVEFPFPGSLTSTFLDGRNLHPEQRQVGRVIFMDVECSSSSITQSFCNKHMVLTILTVLTILGFDPNALVVTLLSSEFTSVRSSSEVTRVLSVARVLACTDSPPAKTMLSKFEVRCMVISFKNWYVHLPEELVWSSLLRQADMLCTRVPRSSENAHTSRIPLGP